MTGSSIAWATSRSAGLPVLHDGLILRRAASLTRRLATGHRHRFLPPEQPGYVMWGQDFNKDYDYALRVQTLDAKFQGKITDNISWRLNVWSMKKEGIRQANSQAHCYPPATYGIPNAAATPATWSAKANGSTG